MFRREENINVNGVKPMFVSILLCTHRSDRYKDFVEALDSLNAQSGENENLEIVRGCRWEQGVV